MFNRTLCYAPNATGWENMPCKYGVPPSIARSDPAWNNEADSVSICYVLTYVRTCVD